MKSEIQIKNSAGVCRIEIEGTIGVPEEWQFFFKQKTAYAMPK